MNLSQACDASGLLCEKETEKGEGEEQGERAFWLLMNVSFYRSQSHIKLSGLSLTLSSKLSIQLGFLVFCFVSLNVWIHMVSKIGMSQGNCTQIL